VRRLDGEAAPRVTSATWMPALDRSFTHAGSAARQAVGVATAPTPASAEPVRLVVADDHPLVLLTLRGVLTVAEGFAIVGEARSGAAAVTVALRCRADLVVVDLRLPRGDGVWVARQLAEEAPRVRVVVISASEHPRDVRQAIEAGAIGYLSTSVDPQDLPGVLRRLLAGSVLSTRRARAGPPPARVTRTTPPG
jgi:CheY-like chemotaxis protein